MTGTWLLARRNVRFHWKRSVVLIACLTVTLSLPLGTGIAIRQFETSLNRRSQSTPILVGATGSRFDLALHALYFRSQPPRETDMAEVSRIIQSDYAAAIPVFARFQAEGFPIVGTTPKYLSFRKLRLSSGTAWKRYGDCLLGADVADHLNLKPGDFVFSDSAELFTAEGSLPLKMRVSGVLAPTRSPDDRAVFVELETAWIIAGIGHGHASEQPHDDSLLEYSEVTSSNIDTFHFHGNRDDFPITAIIAIPNDKRAETLLMGMYLSDDDPAQLLIPREVFDELMTFVVRIRDTFELGFLVMSAVTISLFGLLIALSIRLREREFETLFRLGCSRFLIARLILAELFILTAGGCVCAVPGLIALWITLPCLRF